MKNLKSLLELDKDVFLFGWKGTLSTGIYPYAGVIKTLKGLKENGKTIIVMANSPHTSDEWQKRFGIEGLIDKVVTSADCLFYEIEHKQFLENHFSVTATYYTIGQKTKSLPRQEVDRISNAEFIYLGEPLINGKIQRCIDGFKEELNKALEYSLPMLCINPDMHSIGDGAYAQILQGSLAEYYEINGGLVVSFGKPDATIFELATQGVNVSRAVVVGDGIFSDIKGGNDFGIDTVLVKKSGLPYNIFECDKRFKNLPTEKEVIPTFTIDRV